MTQKEQALFLYRGRTRPETIARVTGLSVPEVYEILPALETARRFTDSDKVNLVKGYEAGATVPFLADVFNTEPRWITRMLRSLDARIRNNEKAEET